MDHSDDQHKEPNREATTLKEFRAKALQDAEEFFGVTNSILGVLSFTAGLACLSLDSSQGYGFASAFFLAAVWGERMQAFKLRLRALRAVPSSMFSGRYVLKRSSIALLGWAFLAAVAVGLIDSGGLAL